MEKKKFTKTRGKSKFSRKPSSKGKGKMRDDAEEVTTRGAENDPSWYLYNATLVSDAASISYSNPLGIPLVDKVNVHQPGSQENEYVTTIVPTLMAIHYTPTLGNIKTGSTSPVNLQARAIYTRLQSSVSMTLPFAASDIAIHIGAVDSLYILYEYCKRIYGLYQSFAAMDRTMPEIYYRAMGFDPITMESPMSMVDFKHRLNKCGSDLSRLYIPKDMAILKRHQWLQNNIYMDSPSIKAQQYMFVPTGIWAFNPTDGSLKKAAKDRNPLGLRGAYGGELVYTPLPDVSHGGLNTLMTFFEGLIRNITNDKDMWMMNAYMLKCYPPEARMQTEIVPDGYSLYPIFSGEVLTQIHNMDVAGDWIEDPADEHYPKIYQDGNDDVVWVPYTTLFNHADMDMSNEFIIDMPFNTPGQVDNLVATRLKVAGYGGDKFIITEYPTEIVNHITVLSGAGDEFTEFTLNTLSVGTCNSEYAYSATVMRDTLRHIAAISHFNMAPMLKLTNNELQANYITGSSGRWYDVISDLTNYTTISMGELTKMHDAAVMGEWFIPDDVKMLNWK